MELGVWVETREEVGKTKVGERKTKAWLSLVPWIQQLLKSTPQREAVTLLCHFV